MDLVTLQRLLFFTYFQRSLLDGFLLTLLATDPLLLFFSFGDSSGCCSLQRCEASGILCNFWELFGPA